MDANGVLQSVSEEILKSLQGCIAARASFLLAKKRHFATPQRELHCREQVCIFSENFKLLSRSELSLQNPSASIIRAPPDLSITAHVHN
jgi:hypothetical protein